MKKREVVKANALIDARYHLSLLELKIILYLISQIERKDKAFKEYNIRVKDFQAVTNIKDTGKIYSYFKTVTKNLLSRPLEIDQEGGSLQINFISSAEYQNKLGRVDICFDPKLKPYLLQLKANFTRYELQAVLQFRSVYSLRIYEMLKSFEGLKQRDMTIDELKRRLMVEDKYTRFYDLKKIVLNTAQRELKEYSSDIYFTFETIREGRYITAVRFKIHKQRQKKFNFDADTQDILDIEKLESFGPYDDWKATEKPMKKVKKPKAKRK